MGTCNIAVSLISSIRRGMPHLASFIAISSGCSVLGSREKCSDPSDATDCELDFSASCSKLYLHTFRTVMACTSSRRYISTISFANQYLEVEGWSVSYNCFAYGNALSTLTHPCSTVKKYPAFCRVNCWCSSKNVDVVVSSRKRCHSGNNAQFGPCRFLNGVSVPNKSRCPNANFGGIVAGPGGPDPTMGCIHVLPVGVGSASYPSLG